MAPGEPARLPRFAEHANVRPDLDPHVLIADGLLVLTPSANLFLTTAWDSCPFENNWKQHPYIEWA